MNTTFNSIKTELLKGVNLIEASAGTGKTYTIAMLALRFVVEQGIDIKKLLVVTFTVAATEELKYRIRNKFVEAKRILDNPQHSEDDTVLNWLNQLPDNLKLLAHQRLETALLDIDQAGIFTIHSFCQRVLREHALESGQLFDAELTADLKYIQQACVDDFWRQHIYERSEWETALLTTHYNNPDTLLKSIVVVSKYIQVYPDYQNIDDLINQFKHRFEQAKTAILSYLPLMKLFQSEEKSYFKDSFRNTFLEQFPFIQSWLLHQSNIPNLSTLNILTYDSLIDGLNKIKLKTLEQRENYLASLNLGYSVFNYLDIDVKNVSLIFRRALLETLQIELEKSLQNLNVLSFDDLIIRLADALKTEKSFLLRNALQQRFSVALIDEFQDTDETQWFIFSSLFASSEHYLYLIGDPKQAIYKFRGADIYSYLDAQRNATHKFTLAHNWRSHPDLVTAVNCLFQHKNPFYLNEVGFNPINPAKTEKEGALYYQNKPIAPMMIWQLDNNKEHEHGYWNANKAGNIICQAVVFEIVELLNKEYQLTHPERSIKPKDIAILVRTNKQAQIYQNALRLAGIASVINNTDSVFSSQEARDLYILLQAIAKQGDIQAIKQALTLDWFGLDGQQVYQIMNNEGLLEQWIMQFINYGVQWQEKGFMGMMQAFISHEKISWYIAKKPLAERHLTNLYHVIELLQKTIVEEHLGINKTLDWLNNEINQINSQEEQQLRLESDDNAIKIITMHRAKGLEYPIVFCPYLWHRSDFLKSEKWVIRCHKEGKIIIDLGSEYFENHREKALLEELAEDLRIVYVAVTRAKYRCYIVWANVRTEKNINDSALAYLLDFTETTFIQQKNKLTDFIYQYPNAFDYQLLIPEHISNASIQKTSYRDLKSPKKCQSYYSSQWQMSSYTALSHLTQKTVSELPEDKAQEFENTIDETITIELPRGSHTGNVIHELLEYYNFEYLKRYGDISEQRTRLCQRYGLNLENPHLIDDLLYAIVSTPLSAQDTHFYLANISDKKCLKEMPFYLIMPTMNTKKINAILGKYADYENLTEKKLCGYLTGFIDLICCYNGRYFVMDYKTNYLASYDTQHLLLAMREHNYSLQYWLYSVVLHQYLQQRLLNYDYETHFGGIYYLFVRGMNPTIPMSGVYAHRPLLTDLEKLSGLFQFS